MRRWPIALLVAVVVVVGIYWLLIREKTVEANLRAPAATAVIGSGSTAVAVGPGGQLMPWFKLSEEDQLPTLPLGEAPKSGRLAGPVLEQARVLGAAPASLRPYLESSYYGETGVDVKLRSGIELRFGDDTQAVVKWKAAAAVLADPSIEALDYVDLHAPAHAAIYGSGHVLPPVE